MFHVLSGERERKKGRRAKALQMPAITQEENCTDQTGYPTRDSCWYRLRVKTDRIQSTVSDGQKVSGVPPCPRRLASEKLSVAASNTLRSMNRLQGDDCCCSSSPPPPPPFAFPILFQHPHIVDSIEEDPAGYFGSGQLQTGCRQMASRMEIWRRPSDYFAICLVVATQKAEDLRGKFRGRLRAGFVLAYRVTGKQYQDSYLTKLKLWIPPNPGVTIVTHRTDRTDAIDMEKSNERISTYTIIDV
ncbi:hypothetical protein B296_00000791 [Ensete ventricosum]|uniref:Uncharacterized protein n=1 Tax=Ensete ventricosum TaxID=4639 RepID=A0A427B9X6_ENSVE|nr:hypothetical protein B296_00000791 [Ensete ventricosum]